MSNVTPWILFQVAQDLGGLGATWHSPEKALEPDIFAEATAGPIGTAYPGQQTTVLRVTQPDLGGALPAGFILLGVEAEFTGRWSGGGTGSRSAPATSVVGAAARQSLGSILLQVNTPTTVIRGGPADTLGFSELDVLDPGFGLRIYGTSSTPDALGNTLRIDGVRTRFHWDAPPRPVRGRGRSRAAMVAGIGL